MADGIKIQFDQGDIDAKTDSEKLSLLLKIAFSNHATLQDHGKILFGNGTQGVCDTLRQNCKAVKAMWGIMLIIVAAIVGMAIR